jgi:hypothetical protein
LGHGLRVADKNLTLIGNVAAIKTRPMRRYYYAYFETELAWYWFIADSLSAQLPALCDQALDAAACLSAVLDYQKSLRFLRGVQLEYVPFGYFEPVFTQLDESLIIDCVALIQGQMLVADFQQRQPARDPDLLARWLRALPKRRKWRRQRADYLRQKQQAADKLAQEVAQRSAEWARFKQEWQQHCQAQEARLHEWVRQQRQQQWQAANVAQTGLDPLAFFGLQPPVSAADLKRAYRRLALQCHPDKGGSQHAFQELQQYYRLAQQGIKQ